MSYFIYGLAFIGFCWVAWKMVWPLIWFSLYATGHLIFDLRTTSPKWKELSHWKRLKACIRQWGKAFVEAIQWPASEVRCGSYTWKPWFQYSGFKKDTPKATAKED